jgi:SAM-dependent methyltransferase
MARALRLPTFNDRMSKLPDYGIDAPGAFRTFFAIGVWGFVFWILFHWAGFLAAGAWGSAMAFFFYASSKWLKQRECGAMLRSLGLRGDERVLDVGCGRGLLLIGAAKRMTTGTAYGIDIWRKRDQSGNSREATEANINAEAVAERVEIQDADARHLPFYDDFFDVVVSNLALHNISGIEERHQALSEIRRVLKPGGRLVIGDIVRGREYARGLRKLGMENVRFEARFPLFLSPFGRVTGRKPTA